MTTFSVEEFRKMAETKTTVFPTLGGILIILAGVMLLIISAQHFIVSVSPQSATGEPLRSDDQVWAVCVGTLFTLFFLMNAFAGFLALKRKDAMKPMLSALIVGTIALLLSASMSVGTVSAMLGLDESVAAPLMYFYAFAALAVALGGIILGGFEGRPLFRMLGLGLPILSGVMALLFLMLIPQDPSISVFLIPLTYTFGAIGIGFIVYSRGEFP